MRRAVPILTAALLASALLGCRGRQPSVVPPPQQPTIGTIQPGLPRVGVVDLQAAARAHPRWKDLAGLNERIARVEIELATVPLPSPVPQTDIQRFLSDEATRMRESFEQELHTLREQRRRDLEAFAEDLRKQQAAKFEAIRKQAEAEAEAAVLAKRDELKAQLRAAEQEIMEEYRYPLLNLRLRAEVAGLRSEEEGRQVLRQLQALQQEREERIREKAEEIEAAFGEYQKVKEAEVNARLKAEQDALNVESEKLAETREREIETELKRAAADREREFQQRIEERRRKLVAAAEAQLRGQQAIFAREVDARFQQLRAELQALVEQRVRLEESILAEVKIEVATIAQAQQLDVVLTRAIARRDVVDLTADVIRKFTR